MDPGVRAAGTPLRPVRDLRVIDLGPSPLPGDEQQLNTVSRRQMPPKRSEADMFTNKNLTYVVAAVVVAGVALVLGMPAYYLIVLACPVMMFFMMSSMSGGNTRNDAAAPDNKPRTKATATTPDGSHDRI